MGKETSLFEKFKETGKHGIIFGIGGVLQRTIVFLLLPIYTTKLLASEYGALGLLTLSGSIIATIFILGINVGLLRTYFDYDRQDKRKDIVSTAFFLILISNFLLLIIGVCFSKNLSYLIFGNYEYRIHFLIIIVTKIFELFNVVPSIILQVKKKSFVFISFQITFLIIRVGSIIYLIIYRDLGILGVLIGNLFVGFLACVVYYFYIRKEIIIKFSKFEAIKILKIGLPLILANLSVFIFSSIDRFFLNYYTNLSEVGLYSLAYNFGILIVILFETPLALIWPVMFFSVKNHKNIKEFYVRSLTYSSAIVFFLFLLVSLLSKEVLRIIANVEYWKAYSVIPIIVLTYTIWSLNRIINVAIVLKKKTQFQSLFFSIGAAINIGLNFLLIPKYGRVGAAISTIIAYIIVMVILFFYNEKIMSVNFEWARIIKILLTTSIIFFIGFYINIESLVISMSIKVFLISLYPFILYLFRFFKKSEINKIKEILMFSLNRIKRKT